jgi:glycosyltransferase involved in cell wall biosynthesis
VAFVAWTTRTGRAEELAAALGGVARLFTGGGLKGRATAPLRYAINAVQTACWLLRLRPRAVAVQNPPTPAAYLVAGYARLARVPLLLDSHPVAFGRKDSKLWGALLPLHRRLARRADLVLVTVEDLAAEVRSWGGRAQLVHEAPPAVTAPAGDPPARDGLRVLFAGVFAPDEPVAAVVEAAAAVPEATVAITGDTDAAPPGLLEGAPPNTEFLGFLEPTAYAEALRDADVVMVLTTEPTSVVRAGYEAVYARRPLIVSDTPVLREVFPHAVHTGDSAAALTAALRRAGAELERLRAFAPRALHEQERRWEAQKRALSDAIGAPA